jgi:hypothetical protein
MKETDDGEFYWDGYTRIPIGTPTALDGNAKTLKTGFDAYPSQGVPLRDSLDVVTQEQ